MTKDILIRELAERIKAMTPLAEAATSDLFTSEERKRIRELAGGDAVFKLSSMLNRLCSETAYHQYGRKKP